MSARVSPNVSPALPARPVVTTAFEVVSMMEVYAQLWPDGIRVVLRDKAGWRNAGRDRLEAGRKMIVAIAESCGVAPADVVSGFGLAGE